jgi:hypothetical protein
MAPDLNLSHSDFERWRSYQGGRQSHSLDWRAPQVRAWRVTVTGGTGDAAFWFRFRVRAALIALDRLALALRLEAAFSETWF